MLMVKKCYWCNDTDDNDGLWWYNWYKRLKFRVAEKLGGSKNELPFLRCSKHFKLMDQYSKFKFTNF